MSDTCTRPSTSSFFVSKGGDTYRTTVAFMLASQPAAPPSSSSVYSSNPTATAATALQLSEGVPPTSHR